MTLACKQVFFVPCFTQKKQNQSHHQENDPMLFSQAKKNIGLNWVVTLIFQIVKISPTLCADFSRNHPPYLPGYHFCSLAAVQQLRVHDLLLFGTINHHQSIFGIRFKTKENIFLTKKIMVQIQIVEF